MLAWLAPWEAVVPFAPRRFREVAAIRRWCVEDGPGGVWLLAGGPGSGKTRLAMRVSHTLRARQVGPWAVGWARAGHGQAAVDVAAGWDRPVLAVVDDADVRDDLAALLLAAHRPVGRQTVRVLLVAREFNDWWTEVQQPLPMAVDVAGRSRLGTLAEDVPRQRVAAKQAVTAYAEQLDVDPTGMQLTGITAGTPLISALTSLADALQQAGRVGEAVAAATEGIPLYQQLGVSSVNVEILEEIIRGSDNGDTR